MSRIEIKNWYGKNLPKLPEHPNRRQFRIKAYEGKMVKIKRRIHTPQQLQQYLIKYAPTAVYCTISEWVAPELLAAKKHDRPGYKWLRNCFVRGDLFLDYDEGKEKNNKEELCFNKFMLAANFLKKTKFEKIVYKRSGKGWHIIVKDFWEKVGRKIENPRDRERYYQQELKKWFMLLKSIGAEADKYVAGDTRRITRVTNTLHHTGTVIEEITYNHIHHLKSKGAQAMTSTALGGRLKPNHIRTWLSCGGEHSTPPSI